MFMKHILLLGSINHENNIFNTMIGQMVSGATKDASLQTGTLTVEFALSR